MTRVKAQRIDSKFANPDSAWSAACRSYLLGLRQCAAPLVITRKNGMKVGWDDEGLHLGSVTIPIGGGVAPISLGGNVNGLTDLRTKAWKKRDMEEHAQMPSKDDLKEATARIRARVDAERKAAPPIVRIPRERQ